MEMLAGRSDGRQLIGRAREASGASQVRMVHLHASQAVVIFSLSGHPIWLVRELEGGIQLLSPSLAGRPAARLCLMQ